MFRFVLLRPSGPVVFLAADATVEEWRRLFRVMYADGGWFARQEAYGLFLAEDHLSNSGNAREAKRLELVGDVLGHSKEEMRQLLEEQPAVRQTVQQLDLSL